ncbi:alanyl-tRNA synthetase [Lutibacter agarilyticus]|uniref:Alanine--tRNA ligase n=1 Tax=Lutibacter agarilyticus TaxID=1109740 RepID=A0A238XW97_9FLAO|nr:alanine--tRNA ligase [Lutibacter agarilyticus]SNR62713.1 alanyl-tRNA synthetase [Lutibacter agarilyticus]
MKSQQIRQQFLDFFAAKKHTIVPSAPMVLKNDPTLMFTNAGMVPFKEYFLGQKKVVNKRVSDSQKCLRVSGKHNDLEEVGKDTYHHTMFEMLGNWSFGDYFKKEAIEWAWELLTEVYKINKDCLYVSVFEGAKEDGLEYDQEAHDIWKELIDEDRIIRGNKKDNFWEMGAQGPCGPCSEIHVDIRSAEEKAIVSGKSLVNMDHPQVVEIWNLVFMEFNRKANGELEKLPAQHVDTGMGFERLCMVLQNVQSNYDTDVFIPIIKEVETITGNDYGKNEEIDIAIRVISDHVRAVAFAIADGQLPSNTGAGYVIRRILRRAVRYGFTFLNTREPFIYKLVAVLTKQMGTYFPELKTQRQLITNVIKEEENSFLRTLDQGLVLLDGIIKNTQGTEVSGKKAFELFDTYGFPIDLTALILSEKKMTLNEEEFETELKKQKARSRAASVVETDDWVILDENDDEEEFVGYDTLTAKVKITRYRKVSSKKDGDMYQLVFNLTPFYPEGGGQVGDKGYLEKEDGSTVYIVNTKKENNLIIHFTKSLPKDLSGTFNVAVDEKQRFRTACNHTATHLLHQALREVLGEHVEQKGSAVHSKHLRFDFSHFSKLSVDELTAVEDFVNARIENKLPLQEFRNIPMETALEKGAMALFGEKYGDTVRAIQYGQSVELCGGTHVQNTGDIWYFRIQTESAIASGIRRIEAITGDAMKTEFSENNRTLFQIKELVKNSKNPAEQVLNLIEDNTKLKKQIDQLLKEKAKSAAAGLVNETELINGIHFLAKKLELDQNSIKDLANDLGNKIENLFLIIGSEAEGKAFLTCYISKNLVAEKKLNAGLVVRELGKLIQGGGGGQPFFASAGGKNPSGIEEALKQAKNYIV